MKVVESETKRDVKRCGLTVKGPTGERMSMQEFLESLPKGTILKFPGGEEFPKLK